MGLNEKLAQLKALLQITDATQDSVLAVYLDLSKAEIISWLWSGRTPEGVTDVPARYEPTQIMAVVTGYGLEGLENQTRSVENTTTREFKYSSMLEFIHANVIPYAVVI